MEETNPVAETAVQKRPDMLEMVRAGGVLAVTSAYFVLAGMAIYMISDPSQSPSQLNDQTRSFIVAGVLVIYYSSCSLLLGLLSAVFNVQSPELTAVTLGQNFFLGIVAFCIIIIAAPVINFQSGDTPPEFPPGSLSTQDAKVALSFGWILSGTSLWACIQGLQIYASAKLYYTQAEGSFRPHVWALMWFATAVLLGGVSMFIFGIVVDVNEGNRDLEPTPFLFYPNAVAHSSMTIISGLVMLCYSATLYSASFEPRSKSTAYAWAIITYLWFIAVHVMTQYGLYGALYAGYACVVTSGVSVMAFSPVVVIEDYWREPSEESSGPREVELHGRKPLEMEPEAGELEGQAGELEGQVEGAEGKAQE